MFSLADGIYQSYFAPPKLSILIIGLDGSGKTALLERIKVTDINSRLDVPQAQGGAPRQQQSLPASYTRDSAIAGVLGANDDFEINGNRRGGQKKYSNNADAGKPARLPPPLPPKKSLKSSQRVEKIMADELYNSLHGTPVTTLNSGNSSLIIDKDSGSGRVNILSNVPPPPLIEATGNSDTSSSLEAAESKQATTTQLKKPTSNKATSKPPLPPTRQKSIETTSEPSSNDEILLQTPNTKKSSFIELFRCPSPGRYSDAALGEEEEEEFLDASTKSASNLSGSASALVAKQQQQQQKQHAKKKETLEPWSTSYLQNYSINYVDSEEFDIKLTSRTAGGGYAKKMFPLKRIRPTLGQNLAKLNLCGCKCSLFDLSGAEKMRPLWDRYYRDTDAIIYVINASESSSSNLLQSRREYQHMIQNEALQRRIQCGLPVLVFANQLDVAYNEYEASIQRANDEMNGRGISWNDDEEDDFVGGGGGGGKKGQQADDTGEDESNIDEEEDCVSKRVVEFHDLAKLYGFPQQQQSTIEAQRRQQSPQAAQLRNVFMFGGSAKSGEGVRAAMEYLVAHAKSHHLATNARR